ncbi:3'-5' exonuclease [Vibrio splendidus]
MNGVQADNLDGSDETTGDYVSLFHGDVPTVEHFDTMSDEFNFVIDTIRQLEADGVPTQDICLVARTDQIRQPYMAALQQHGILVYPVSRTSADDRSKPGVRVANMHRIKGLEFQYVIIVGVNDGNVPFYRAKSDDIVEQRALEFSERALFHVAATRAIKQLFVSSNTKKSPFLV